MKQFSKFCRANPSGRMRRVFVSGILLLGIFSMGMSPKIRSQDPHTRVLIVNPNGYLAHQLNPYLNYVPDAEKEVSPDMTAAVPSYRQFIARMNATENEAEVEEEVASSEPVNMPLDEEPVRRTVATTDFGAGGDTMLFPRPVRDTQNFEDIYLFFPVQDGDKQKVGLVQGQLNGSMFSPPTVSAPRSRAVFETISR